MNGMRGKTRRKEQKEKEASFIVQTLFRNWGHWTWKAGGHISLSTQTGIKTQDLHRLSAVL
jgi:hypothetical protein